MPWNAGLQGLAGALAGDPRLTGDRGEMGVIASLDALTLSPKCSGLPVLPRPRAIVASNSFACSSLARRLTRAVNTTHTTTTANNSATAPPTATPTIPPVLNPPPPPPPLSCWGVGCG